MTVDVVVNGRVHRVEVVRERDALVCRVDGQPVDANAVEPRPNVLSLLIEGRSYELRLDRRPEDTGIVLDGRRHPVEVRDPRSLRARRAAGAGAEGPRRIKAPMPGKVVRILSSPGTTVEAGQGVLVIEAMKMQNELKSPKSGTVSQILAEVGATVNAGDVVAVVE